MQQPSDLSVNPGLYFTLSTMALVSPCSAVEHPARPFKYASFTVLTTDQNARHASPHGTSQREYLSYPHQQKKSPDSCKVIYALKARTCTYGSQ
jgi:hypothetical protein